MSIQRPTRILQVKLDDVQGLLRFAFKRHTEASFLLLRVKDPGAARAWLAQAPVTSAVTFNPPPNTALQLAFTSEGLRALGVATDIIDGFSIEFIAGMTSDPNRARRLGDVGPNDPSHWHWGVGQRIPHVAVLLYAAPGHLEEWQRTIEAQCNAGFEQIARLLTSDMKGFEPFGFVDGISQPKLDWARERPALDQCPMAYTNLSCLGEYLLGFPNEYGLYTPRPLLDPQRDAGGMLPRAEDAPDKSDVGRNGSYLVMRQLRQNVHGFWQSLDRYAGGDPGERQRLAEAMVGRTLQGEPLVGTENNAIDGDIALTQRNLNAFTYRSDPQGLRCPLGAHIRRTNPRNADLPPGKPGILSQLTRILGFDTKARGQDLVASTRFHRLLRRGREYGTAVPLAQALTGPSSGVDPGLHFICLGANIARQFEFVQSAWVMSPKFNGLADESDPLVGNRLPDSTGIPTDTFLMPQPDGPDSRLIDLPRFVTVLGGAYFFLPGIRALRFLSTVQQ